jgi:LPPG:FO 2-phospho-L-lactate transferase
MKSADPSARPTPGTASAVPRVVLLSGGFGGARLVPALSEALPAGSLSVIANVGDDLEWFGLRVCPDVDSILYALAGRWHEAAGWGQRDETFRVGAALAALGAPAWFNVGDLDLAFQLLRADLLRSGRTLTEATRELARRLGIGPVDVLPASDQPCETHVLLEDGRVLHFQEWYVREGAEPPVRQVRVPPGPAAKAALDALRGADAVILGPSSPVASIGPILARDGVADAVRRVPRRIAVAPVAGRPGALSPGAGGEAVRTGGEAVRHHARARQQLLAAEGVADRPADIARRYAGLVRHFVLDHADAGDAAEISGLGLDPVTCDLLSPGELATALAELSAGRPRALRPVPREHMRLGRVEAMHEQPALHLLRSRSREVVKELDEVRYVGAVELARAAGEGRLRVEAVLVPYHQSGDHIGLTWRAAARRHAVDVHVEHVGTLRQHPADEPRGDELAHLAQPAFLTPMGEVEPAVPVAPAHVPGAQPPAAGLSRGRVRVAVVCNGRSGVSRPHHELADLPGPGLGVVLPEHPHVQQALRRTAERAHRALADGITGKAALHRPVPFENPDPETPLEWLPELRRHAGAYHQPDPVRRVACRGRLAIDSGRDAAQIRPCRAVVCDADVPQTGSGEPAAEHRMVHRSANRGHHGDHQGVAV